MLCSVSLGLVVNLLLTLSPAAGTPLHDAPLTMAPSCRLFPMAEQGLQKVGGGSDISVAERTDSLEKGMRLVP